MMQIYGKLALKQPAAVPLSFAGAQLWSQHSIWVHRDLGCNRVVKSPVSPLRI